MQKIDRLVWAEGACFESYGVKIGVRANRRDAIEQILPSLPPSWRSLEPPRKLDILYSWLVGGEHRPNIRSLDLMYSGPGRIVRTSKRQELLETFERDLRTTVAAISRRFVFIHAGVVGWRGRALVMPGRTFTGKSTLVEALVRLGADYFSDEYAVLDTKGYVHPFAKPISVRTPVTLKQEKLAVADIGGRTSERPIKVKVILVTRYRQGARSLFRQASPGRGALDLIANAVAVRGTPERVVGITRKTSVGATILRGSRGEAGEAAEQLLTILERT